MYKRFDKPGDVDTSALTGYEKATSNNWYIFGDHPELQEMITTNFAKMYHYNEIGKTDPKAAFKLLLDLIPGVDPSAALNYPFVVEYPSQFKLGAGTYVNIDFEVISSGFVTIGKNCFIGPHCRIYTPNHHVSDLEMRRRGWQYDAPVTIGDDVWFGGSVVVCPGVQIGNNVVVGAGSVVTKDVPDSTVIGGNPARPL